MRELTLEEQNVIAGGCGGVNTGDVGSGNSTGNGNTVSLGGNTVDLSDNLAGNDVTINVDTNNRTVDRLVLRVENYVDRIVGGVL